MGQTNGASPSGRTKIIGVRIDKVVRHGGMSRHEPEDAERLQAPHTIRGKELPGKHSNYSERLQKILKRRNIEDSASTSR